MPKRIAVVYGGWSSEAEVSRKSGRAVANALRELGYEVAELELTREVALKLAEIKPDLVFPVLHGKPGEDGSFQGMLEIMGIPYVGEGVKTSAVCMDKDWTKRILRSAGINTPDWWVIRRGETLEVEKFKEFPLVVKPAEEGSSVGLSIVKNAAELEEAIKKLLGITEKVIVERFVEGREFTVGFVKGKLFTPIEIVPLKGIYDFEAKYTEGLTDFVPLREEKLKEKLWEVARRVIEALEVKQLCRIDLRVDDEGNPSVLEVNTLPGMTETSLLPRMAAEEGLDFKALISLLVN
jgi:D-alanine-D-alanine ligase